jgi:hypothetical protein
MLLQLAGCCDLLNFVLGAMEVDTAQQDTGRILSIFLGFLPSMVPCVSWLLGIYLGILRFLVFAFLSCCVNSFLSEQTPF